jgi:CubicO group peptidase (beta-lactamase class C family)
MELPRHASEAAIVAMLVLVTCGSTAAEPTLPEQRHAFQQQEITTGRPGTFVFNPGETPRIIWRDVDEVRRLGGDGTLRVRWFDAELNEVSTPTRPGRYGAFVEGVAPNGTPVRRALTFYCRPPGFFLYFPPAIAQPLAYQRGPIAEPVWREHADEIAEAFRGPLLTSFTDHEASAVLLSGLSQASPLRRTPQSTESARVANDEYQLALKLAVLHLPSRTRPLAPPHKRSLPAPVLHDAALADAGVVGDARTRMRSVCRDWAADSREPFVTLVARHGVVVVHEAFGGVPLDYRADVASITKTSTAMLFARFVDQGLLRLDDPAAAVFPDYPKCDPHVPTFRQCLTHTSGLTGHGDFGGVRNAHLDNIILNGIDANEPGKKYNYSGMGFDLAAEAMELVSGKSAVRLYAEDLFAPLGIGDVPMENASSGAQFTAWQLGVLAQVLANEGSYGNVWLFSADTFRQLLPQPLGDRYPGIAETEGVGIHWLRHPKSGAPADSKNPNDFIFSPRTIGHGSLSSCIFLIDLERDLVVVQVRRQAGLRFGEWSTRFFQTIADTIMESDGAAAAF